VFERKKTFYSNETFIFFKNLKYTDDWKHLIGIRPRVMLSGKKFYAYPVHSSWKYRKPGLLGYRQGLSSKHWFVNKTWSFNNITLQKWVSDGLIDWSIILAIKKNETM
jgi:hypothetical protein